MTSYLDILGQEVPHGLWNPTILGVLTVLAAVGLFCGSVYLLLGTNLGARLGFLVAFAGLTAFLVLLTTLWWTSGNSGIDPPHGNSPAWEVVDVASSPSASKVSAVHNIKQNGTPLPEEQLSNVKPAIDAAIVPATPVAGVETPKQPFATAVPGLASSTDYLIDFTGFQAYVQGGGTRNLFWHNPRYAAVELCVAKKDDQGNNVIPPTCDPLQATHFVILRYNLGSLRQPVVAYWFASITLFGLSLLMLHWYELDERKRKRERLTPVPSPGS